jgi:hypothetical protein
VESAATGGVAVDWSAVLLEPQAASKSKPEQVTAKRPKREDLVMREGNFAKGELVGWAHGGGHALGSDKPAQVLNPTAPKRLDFGPVQQPDYKERKT